MKRILAVFLVLSLHFMPACRKNQGETMLILHAGSLSIPFRQMADAFMVAYPDITVMTEAAGSRACARKITELGSRADVLASADSEVIRTLLIPEFASYCIDFAQNEMVLMYGKNSRFSDQISSDNWHDILRRDGVTFGHSDPNADPCGYRALLVMQLAEHFYSLPDLYKKLLEKRSEKHIRSKETDLLALLETGELDYLFIYRSVAEQHRGFHLLLPDEINLKSTARASFYSQAQVEITGKSLGETMTRKGSPIIYGLTVPRTARSPDLGARFVGFVLSPTGRAVMERNGQSTLTPPRVDNFDSLPDPLRIFFPEKSP